jgi:hypothetical protein
VEIIWTKWEIRGNIDQNCKYQYLSYLLVPDKLARSKPGYHNLETFQKQKPEQRLVPLYCWQNYKILLNNRMLVVCVFNEALQRRMIN